MGPDDDDGKKLDALESPIKEPAAWDDGEEVDDDKTGELDTTPLERPLTLGMAAKHGRTRLLEIALLLGSTLNLLHIRLLALNRRERQWEDMRTEVAAELWRSSIALQMLMESELPMANPTADMRTPDPSGGSR